MSNNKLDKDGLNKVWLKGWELLKTLIGNVDTTKGTLQEQIDYVAENSTAMKDIKQAEFDEKTDEERAGKLWNITDAPSIPISAILINDQAPSRNMAYSSEKVEEMLSKKGGTNPNLLDNPWFTVNQRGQSEYTDAGYTVDRWRMGDELTLKTLDNGVQIINDSGIINKNLMQIIPADVIKNLAGKTITLSVDATGNIQAVLGVNGTYPVGTDNEDSSRKIVTLTYTLPSNLNSLVIFIQPHESNVIVHSVKLELGSVSTLAMDTAPDYATELMKCRRYFQRISGKNDMACFIGGTNSTDVYFPFMLETSMRTVPTLKCSSLPFAAPANGNSGNATNQATKLVVTGSMNGKNLQLMATFTTAIDGIAKLYFNNFTNASASNEAVTWDFSADL